MERSLEQRYAIKFCVRLGKNATETFQMLQKAFKDDCISRSQSGKWHKAFKEGREEVADKPRSGRPTTARTEENVDRVLEVLPTDRRLSIQKIADTLHMSTFVIHGIVTEDLQMRKGETVNSAFYLDVLRRLKHWIARVRTDIKDTVKLHHDNATSHTAFIITNFLDRSNTPKAVHGIETSKRKVKDEVDTQTPAKKTPKISILDHFSSVSIDRSTDAVLARMIALDGLPFSVLVTSKDLRKCLNALGHEIPLSAETIKIKVCRYADTFREKVVRELQMEKEKGQLFSLTLDEWTSIRSKRYLNINIHSRTKV
ncbi:hypothetical protein LAZ67_1006676 [Cordylochernes scorpioides]|uniref:Mos1 transposase HTH domain-containing protein n=1 Tax=Cordylochernes scorpioides TaxID=51811 RepID=A0ABY6JYY8_9ARAC|nr:hypothetical protein LAZ67_1006676 [Cordylochernes scorpioides]